MKTEELIAFAENWKNENENRTAILILSEENENGLVESSCIIKGNRLKVLLSLYVFMEDKIGMLEEATTVGALNKIMQDVQDSIPLEKSDKNKDAIFKLIKDLEKLHTKHS